MAVGSANVIRSGHIRCSECGSDVMISETDYNYAGRTECVTCSCKVSAPGYLRGRSRSIAEATAHLGYGTLIRRRVPA